MKTTNRTVLDLSKVQHGSFWYVNQHGQTSFNRPIVHTVRLVYISDYLPAMWHTDWPNETELERAKRLNLLDTWTPVVSFQLTANHSIQYTGKKAVVMWKAWNERIFNKKKGYKK